MNIEEITLDSKLDIKYLAKEKQDFFSKSFTFTWNEEKRQGEAKEKIFDDNFNYQVINKKRKREEREGTHYATQMMNDSKNRVNINYVTTAAFVIGNFTLKDGGRKKFVICDLKRREDPFFQHEFNNSVLMAQPFFKCVNILQTREAKGYSNMPLLYSAFCKVSQKLLLWDKNKEAIGFDFVGYRSFPVFGHTDFQKKIRMNLVKNPWWLKTMDVEFLSKDGTSYSQENCVIDTRYNSLVATYTFEIDIDLNEVMLTSSRKIISDNIVYDEFLDGQGKQSSLYLIPYENIFSSHAFKPDCNSPNGLARVGRPAFYSEMFNTHYDDKKIAVTNGYRCHPNAFLKKN